MIGNLISPALSLGLIRGEIAKKLKKEVNEYKILYKENSEPYNLFFIVENLTHPFNDDGKISSIIKEQLKTKVPDKTIDAFLITYEKPKNEKAIVNAKIFYSYEDSNGERINEFIETKI